MLFRRLWIFGLSASLLACVEASDPQPDVDVGAAESPLAIHPSITVSPDPAFVVAGGTVQLSAATTPPNRKVHWASSSSAIAAVDAAGLVQGVAPGVATITATSGASDGTATVTVQPRPPAIASPTSGVVTTNGPISVAGTAMSGASVTVFDGVDAIGTSSADAAGAFVVAVTLSAGTHALSAKETVNGVTSASSSVVSITVPTPTITTPADGLWTTDAAITVSGRADPGADVSIMDGIESAGATTYSSVATATADSTGRYAAAITASIGRHSLVALEPISGAQSAAVSVTVAPPPPSDLSATVSGDVVTLYGVGVTGATIDVMDGDAVVTSTTAGSGGFQAVLTLSAGVHSLTTTQTVNDVLSEPSDPVSVTIASP